MEIGGRDNETTSEGDREGIRNSITRTNGSSEHYNIGGPIMLSKQKAEQFGLYNCLEPGIMGIIPP